MSIKDNLADVRKHIPENVKLVCVSKFHPQSTITEAYNCGERIFGESRVQELLAKQSNLPTDIQWHFIGHLQSNKIRQIIPFVSLIEGVDSGKLLKEINALAEKSGRVVPCLLQMHIAEEETKFGFSQDELLEMLSGNDFGLMANVRICGLMGMATYTDNQSQIRKEFRLLKQFHDKLKIEYFADNTDFMELSMGMSDDYRIAIEEGSTMVRIGSSIFGKRQ